MWREVTTPPPSVWWPSLLPLLALTSCHGPETACQLLQTSRHSSLSSVPPEASLSSALWTAACIDRCGCGDTQTYTQLDPSLFIACGLYLALLPVHQLAFWGSPQEAVHHVRRGNQLLLQQREKVVLRVGTVTCDTSCSDM